MKKKIKDLTVEEITLICGRNLCSKQCPLRFENANMCISDIKHILKKYEKIRDKEVDL